MAISSKTLPLKKEPKEVPIKLPKTLAACADRLYTVKRERLDQQKELELKLKNLVREERALTDHLIETLPKGEASGISGSVARATIVTKPVPTVEDRAKLEAYIKKTGEFDLLSMSINASAVKERWEANKKVPGIGVFNAVSVSLNKL